MTRFSSTHISLILSSHATWLILLPVSSNGETFKSLSLSNKPDLDDYHLKNILSGTPRLETFELNDCYGFSRIAILSKSVKNFVISGRKRLDAEYVHVNAPYILSLTVDGALTSCSLYFVNLSSFSPVWKLKISSFHRTSKLLMMKIFIDRWHYNFMFNAEQLEDDIFVKTSTWKQIEDGRTLADCNIQKEPPCPPSWWR
ncbi:putative F-box/LRR-repeat protein [Tanacetum coccineum]